MEVDHKKCVTCSNCVPICPMGAIYIDPAINSLWDLQPSACRALFAEAGFPGRAGRVTHFARHDDGSRCGRRDRRE